jgi:hypothetical protein
MRYEFYFSKTLEAERMPMNPPKFKLVDVEDQTPNNLRYFGRLAYRQGLPITACPKYTRPEEISWWRAGWYDAELTGQVS